MIEVNVKAKPFNAAEAVIGSELMWVFAECQLIGSHYIYDNPPAHKGKSVLALPQPGKYSKTDRAICVAGWMPTKDGKPHQPFSKYARARLVEGVGVVQDKIYLCSHYEFFDTWRNAAEVCRMMGLNYQSEQDRAIVKYVHQIVVEGFRVKLDKDGTLLGVVPPVKVHPHPEEIDLPIGMGGFGVAMADNIPPNAVMAGWGNLNAAVNPAAGMDQIVAQQAAQAEVQQAHAQVAAQQAQDPDAWLDQLLPPNVG